MKTCNVEGCEKSHHARGWCDSHYRWSRDNGWAEPDYLLPVIVDGIRMRRLDSGVVCRQQRRSAAGS